MFQWDQGLCLTDCPLWLDSRAPRQLGFVSHAHSDHLGQHVQAICTAPTAALAEKRVGVKAVTRLVFGEAYPVHPKLTIRLLPAGHVLGSAMLHATNALGQTLLYTGDFKLRAGGTVERPAPEPADVLITESTYGLPHFRFPPREVVVGQLCELVHATLRAGRQPVVHGYSLGKAQEVVHILTSNGFPVTEHGAVANMSDVYRQFGVNLGPTRRYAAADFHGPRALDLAERGVLVAPPQTARGAFTSRFGDKAVKVMMTGWALTKGAHFRYGVDHCLPLSDHADFDELLQTIEIVRPKKVYTVHGFPAFVDHLKRRGIDARLAKPEAQMSLFD